MKSKSLSSVLVLLLIAILFQMSFVHTELHAAKNKDVILVLDTSLSMRGFSGKNIFEQVKKSVASYIETLSKGDRITFMTFDAEVKVYPSVLIYDSRAKEILKDYISMTEATGKWTNTFMMMEKVIETAKDLEKKDPERQTVIVVMTDGIDDPAPKGKKFRFDIAKMTPGGSQGNWWIHLITFNELKKKQDIGPLKALFIKVFEKHGSVDVHSGNYKDAGNALAATNKIDSGRQPKDVLGIVLIGLGIIALIGLIIFFIKRIVQVKVFGRLEFWNNEVLDPYIEHADLTKKQAKEVVVGKSAGSNMVNIREYEGKVFVLKAARLKGKIGVSVMAPEGTSVEFINNEGSVFLSDGDIFRVNNFTFKYINR